MVILIMLSEVGCEMVNLVRTQSELDLNAETICRLERYSVEYSGDRTLPSPLVLAAGEPC